MPKVTGPLFSFSASGSVAKVLTFRTTRHGFVVQRTPQNIVSRTEWQLIERQTMRDAAAAWAALDANDRQIWNSNSLPTIRSGWMSFFMEWKAQRIQPGKFPLIPSHYVGTPTRYPFPPPLPVNDLGLLSAHGPHASAIRGGFVSADRGTPYAHGASIAFLHGAQRDTDRAALPAHGVRGASRVISLPAHFRGDLVSHGSRPRLRKL